MTRRVRYFAGVGDYFITLVDVEATAEQAAGLANSLTRWLVETGVAQASTCTHALGAGTGHAPGPRWTEVVVQPDALPPGLRTGIEVGLGARVYDSGRGEYDGVACPHCGGFLDFADPATGEPTELADTPPVAPEDDDAATLCPHCATPVDFNDWEWSGDGQLAFGHLSVRFWNWPQLNPDFVAQVGERLGHRLIVLAGTL